MLGKARPNVGNASARCVSPGRRRTRRRVMTHSAVVKVTENDLRTTKANLVPTTPLCYWTKAQRRCDGWIPPNKVSAREGAAVKNKIESANPAAKTRRFR